MRKKNLLTTLCLMTLAGSLAVLSGCDDKAAAGNPATEADTNAVAASSKSVSGIQIEDVVVGEGTEAHKGNKVSVNYLGTLASNGKKFDSSYDRNEPFTFKLGSGQVIEGWEKGIVGMREGGKRILTIPPEKAYGPNGYPPVIPPNATLKFEVELVEVQ